MYLDGLTQRESSQKLNLNILSVHYILKKHKLNKTIENLPKIGRPKKLSDREERRLIIKSKQNPFHRKRQVSIQLNDC